MKRTDLKRLMKPLIRECIHEVLVDEGILAKVVTEVAKGMGNVIVENRPVTASTQPTANINQEAIDAQKKHLDQQEVRERRYFVKESTIRRQKKIRRKKLAQRQQKGSTRQ